MQLVSSSPMAYHRDSPTYAVSCTSVLCLLGWREGALDLVKAKCGQESQQMLCERRVSTYMLDFRFLSAGVEGVEGAVLYPSEAGVAELASAP